MVFWSLWHFNSLHFPTVCSHISAVRVHRFNCKTKVKTCNTAVRSGINTFYEAYCMTAMLSIALTRLNDPMPMLMPPLKWMCVLLCFSMLFVTFAKAWQSLVRETTSHFNICLKCDNVLYLFCAFSQFLFMALYPQQKPPPSSLLVNLITVSDSHPSFDEAHYTLIQERESCFLQKNFGIAQFCMHLFCQQEHHHVEHCLKGSEPQTLTFILQVF